jgi:hypothetical protein
MFADPFIKSLQNKLSKFSNNLEMLRTSATGAGSVAATQTLLTSASLTGQLLGWSIGANTNATDPFNVEVRIAGSSIMEYQAIDFGSDTAGKFHIMKDFFLKGRGITLSGEVVTLVANSYNTTAVQHSVTIYYI